MVSSIIGPRPLLLLPEIFCIEVRSEITVREQYKHQHLVWARRGGHQLPLNWAQHNICILEVESVMKEEKERERKRKRERNQFRRSLSHSQSPSSPRSVFLNMHMLGLASTRKERQMRALEVEFVPNGSTQAKEIQNTDAPQKSPTE